LWDLGVICPVTRYSRSSERPHIYQLCRKKIPYIQVDSPVHNAFSNNNFLGLLMAGDTEYSAGLGRRYELGCNKESQATYIEVPQFVAGFPMMMLSDTPAILSFFPKAEASNK